MTADALLSGHRERLKSKFLNGSFLEDYELLELLLTYAIPRKDVKLLAKALLTRFGSLGNVLTASAEDLQEIDGVKRSTATLLKLTASMTQSILKKDLIQKTVLTSWEAIENYCYALLGRETKEFVYVILLDASCRVINVVQIQKGTVDQTSVYIREVVEALLKNHAVSFILVHNHPSGDTRPSPADIHITNTLQETTAKMNILMQDHFIVSPKGINSFKLMGLMKDYKKN